MAPLTHKAILALAALLFQCRQSVGQHLRARYGAPDPYTSDSCGKPIWASVDSGSPLPDRAFAAGFDRYICDGTICGRDLYVSLISDHGGRFTGKTWFQREDACSNSIIHGQSVVTKHDCRVLVMGSAQYGSLRFAWIAVSAYGNNQNIYDAPAQAMTAGNNEGGPTYVCRFRTSSGDQIVGSTYFPRRDSFCCSAEFNGAEIRGSTCEVLITEPCQT